MKIDIAGGTLEFVEVELWRYVAEFNGQRIPIRQHSIWHQVVEGGGGRREVTEEEGMEPQRLGELHDIRGAEPERRGETLVFSFEWTEHFRKGKNGRVEISLREGVVVYDAEAWEQDDSYY